MLERASSMSSIVVVIVAFDRVETLSFVVFLVRKFHLRKPNETENKSNDPIYHFVSLWKSQSRQTTIFHHFQVQKCVFLFRRMFCCQSESSSPPNETLASLLWLNSIEFLTGKKSNEIFVWVFPFQEEIYVNLFCRFCRRSIFRASMTTQSLHPIVES